MVNYSTFDSREEWLKHRQRIGGSDAACILNENPYKTAAQLWDEKHGDVQPKDISDNVKVIYGTIAEDKLRELFALDFRHLAVEYEPNNFWTNDKYPFAHASLDGWFTDANSRKGILEIKTTEITNGEQWKLWDNRIPTNYYIQCLHYMMVTEFDYAILKAQIKTYRDEMPELITRHYLIERNEDEINFLAEKEKEFSDSLTNGVRPFVALPEI